MCCSTSARCKYTCDGEMGVPNGGNAMLDVQNANMLNAEGMAGREGGIEKEEFELPRLDSSCFFFSFASVPLIFFIFVISMRQTRRSLSDANRLNSRLSPLFYFHFLIK